MAWASRDTYNGEVTALEARADTASLEGLHVQRRQLLPEYAALRALHGNNGKWDAKRKQLLEALKVRVRIEAQAKNEKVTEGLVDALAHAQDQYIQFIDEGIVGATRYFEVQTAMDEITEQIEARSAAIFAYSAEARLGR